MAASVNPRPAPAPLTRRGFAAWLALAAGAGLAAGALSGCAREGARDGAGDGAGGGEAWAGLAWERSLPLEHATQFVADFYEGGYARLALADGSEFVVVPEGAAPPEALPEGAAVLAQPLDRIYLVATQAMDYVRALGRVGSVRLSGTAAESWHIPEARAAMEAGEMLYAGKYNAPDYELVVDEGCDLAVENTMVLHNPEVKEQLESLGVPVLVDRSSYEAHPLGRMEWVKLYGVLLGCEDSAEEVFDGLMDELSDVLGAEPTGLTCAFFSVTAAGAVNVHKPGGYVSKCVELAGGTYLPEGEPDGGAQSTMNMQMEAFYAAAKDADRLIYNSSIEAELATLDELVAKDASLVGFKAVREGRVWRVGRDLFQEPLGLGRFIRDVHEVLADPDVGDGSLSFLRRLS